MSWQPRAIVIVIVIGIAFGACGGGSGSYQSTPADRAAAERAVAELYAGRFDLARTQAENTLISHRDNSRARAVRAVVRYQAAAAALLDAIEQAVEKGDLSGKDGIDDRRIRAALATADRALAEVIDELAALGVFHLALGGGESADLPWLGDVARHARSRGLVPNLTTSGLSGLDRLLDIAHLFGQINVSIDGLADTYARVRGFDGFARADAAVRALRARKPEIGINVVVTRHNFDQLPDLFAYARSRRLDEVELLRFKPSGRGKSTFSDLCCTDDQHRALLPAILAASRRHRIRVRVDCSYTPMLAHHDPGPELLAQLAVYGCTGGDFLIGAKATGAITACSFAPPPPRRPRLTEISGYWDQPDAFGAFRTWRDAEEPCRSCSYHALCRGGCKVVSLHVAGDLSQPDPECPRVVDWRRGRGPGTSRTHLPVLG